MKNWFKIAVITLLLISSKLSWATIQTPDYLIIGKDTFPIFSEPLEYYYDRNPFFPRKIFGKDWCSTACWRGYVGYWKLEESRLYLVKIEDCCDKNNSADLKKLFGNQCIDGKVFADWVTGNLRSPQGKYLWNDNATKVYEKEIIHEFIDGNLVAYYQNDNSKSYISPYSQNEDKLNQFIGKNIQWDKLPNLDGENNRVWVRLKSGETKENFTLEIAKGINKIYNDEALRVVRSLGEWNVYYQYGKLVQVYWVIPVNFDGQTRKEYQK